MPSGSTRGIMLKRKLAIRLLRRAGPVLAGRIAEVAEEIRIRLEQQTRVVVLQALLVGLHGAIEREEVGVLAAEGLGEDAVALTVALAADPLARRLRLGQQHGHVAIGLGADLLRALAALG